METTVQYGGQFKVPAKNGVDIDLSQLRTVE
jgi:hypothetical protein